MGLLPLEFSDCLLDSPYYRENLRAHEKQLEQTSGSIKALISGITEVLDSAKLLIRAKKTLADTLDTCQFDCLGTTLTDDEILIASSLKQFAKFLSAMEDEMNGILLQAHEKFITPLLNFRKEQIGSVKNTKKAFERATSKLCTAQDKYVAMSGKKEESLAEAADTVRHEQRSLQASSLEYVHLMHVVQERKKFEFVEAILHFTQSWVNYYRRGAEVARDQEDYMTDLQHRVQKTRDNFSATSEKFESLKEKMLTSGLDPGLLNKMYTRQGYLFVQGKKNLKLGSVWTKYFCQYQAKSKTLTMIPYSQLSGKVTGGEVVRVTSCVCHDEARDKFRFTVTGEDTAEAGLMVTHHIQALSEFERKNWVEALGGTWPAVNTLQRIRADSVEDNLNSAAFTFLKDCLSELESRGLADQGLYRVGGVVSKVKKLLNQALDPSPGEECPDMSDPKQWESKTLASAVKQYFRDLSKPLMTYQLYTSFLEAVKKEEEASRLNEIYLVLQKLPRANREILKVLIRHLNKVSLKSDKNLMTASNLGVVFGPSLLRPREETVASIMDIKFCNEVIASLIENCERFFSSAESSPEFLHSRRPSLESRSTAATCSTAEAAASPAASAKCKRTQSFSSFSSQLSSASLPDIKEFHQERAAATPPAPAPAPPTVPLATRTQPPPQQPPAPAPATLPRLAASERPRSKSHQHEVTAAAAAAAAGSARSSSSKESSPAPLHLSRAATQEDLMASLEMMNLLAADLPSSASASVSPLKRSYTLNPKRLTAGQRAQARTEVTRKPPLPKLLSAVPLSPSTTPPPPFSRQNSAPAPATPRPSDLPAKLISAFEGLCSPGAGAGLVIEEAEQHSPAYTPATPPAPRPAPRYTNYIQLVVGGAGAGAGDAGSVSSQSSGHSPRPRDSGSQERGGSGGAGGAATSLPWSLTSVSLDSGVLTSPSPPTDSGIALLSPATQHRHFNNNNNSSSRVDNNRYKVSHLSYADQANEDSASVLSCSLSEASEASGSKYDNVAVAGGRGQAEAAGRAGEEDDLSDTSNLLDPLDLEDESSGCEVGAARHSGQYDNLEAAVDTGLTSLRRMLTTGQTTNV